jgi:hypothetical protein
MKLLSSDARKAAADSKPDSSEEQDWLTKVSPICLQMIETALEAGVATTPCAKGHSE